MKVWLIVSGATQNLGGVSTHVRMIHNALTRQGSNSMVLTPRAIVRRRLAVRAADVVHVHVSHPRRLRLLALNALLATLGPRRCLITFHHGPAAQAYSRSAIDRAFLRVLLWRLGAVVALNDEHAQFFARLSPRTRLLTSSSYIGAPAAVPASSLPQPWVEHPGDGSEVTGWVVTSGNETPLYGFHDLLTAIEACQGLGLRICTYGPNGDPKFVESLLTRVQQSTIPVAWYRGLTQRDFARCLSESSIYVRNTTGDTLGLALAEAIELGTPAIATDVCKRPEGVRTYTRGDRASLLAALHTALATNLSTQQHDAIKRSGKDAFASLYAVYEEVAR